jgi:hypothetical protein
MPIFSAVRNEIEYEMLINSGRWGNCVPMYSNKCSEIGKIFPTLQSRGSGDKDNASKMPNLVEAPPGREADQVAEHEAGEGLPLPHRLGGLETDGELEAALAPLPAPEANQLDVEEHFHVSLVQLALHQALDALGREDENSLKTYH